MKTFRNNMDKKNADQKAEDTYISEGGFVEAEPEAEKPVNAAVEERRKLMLEYGIKYNGRQYQYKGIRYNRLEDAVGYARLVQASKSTH